MVAVSVTYSLCFHPVCIFPTFFLVWIVQNQEPANNLFCVPFRGHDKDQKTHISNNRGTCKEENLTTYNSRVIEGVLQHLQQSRSCFVRQGSARVIRSRIFKRNRRSSCIPFGLGHGSRKHAMNHSLGCDLQFIRHVESAWFFLVTVGESVLPSRFRP